MTFQLMIKRTIDILLSLIFIFFISPVYIILGIAIKLDSPGPIFFKQQRVGKNNKIFLIYKFRSMQHKLSENEKSPVDFNDKRLTKVGKIIRKYSLDELPQIFNVLKGEMSLIGPRAITPQEVKKRILAYEVEKQLNLEDIKLIYTVRTYMKPGMTGLTQVNGRSNAGIIMATELDYSYVKNWNLLLDFKILLKTFQIVINKKGSN